MCILMILTKIRLFKLWVQQSHNMDFLGKHWENTVRNANILKHLISFNCNEELFIKQITLFVKG